MKHIYLLYVLCLLTITLIFTAQAQYIYSMAGSEDFGDGGPAIEATLDGPNDIYVDKAGHIYISDRWNGRIRRIDAETGIIETVAGNGTYVLTTMELLLWKQAYGPHRVWWSMMREIFLSSIPSRI